MANTTYGTGSAVQFSSGEQRQVLELGDKIHYYNPNVTPIFSLFGMQSVLTPVPIFEWMEDEYMIKKSEKTVFAWGNCKEKTVWVKNLVKAPLCFGKNKNGSPKHPLYLPKNTPLVKFL